MLRNGSPAFFILLVSSYALSAASWGAPVLGEEKSLRQPDGERVAVRVWGDEFYQRVESLDGYTLLRDPGTGVICYARVSEDGQGLVSSGIRVERCCPSGLKLKKGLREAPGVIETKASARESKFLGGKPKSSIWPSDWRRITSGDVKGITLLIDFPDEPAVFTAGRVALYLNMPGYSFYGNVGSIYDYFDDVSNGKLRFTNWSPAAYYTAQHEKAYYDMPDDAIGSGAKALILEALNYYESQGFDFSPYDSNGDGYIDALSCMFVGDSESGWAMGLTAHAGRLDGFEADGVKSGTYHLTPMESALNISKFVHECGHMLFGWMDLYDHDMDAKGLGEYCLMSYGSYPGDPVHPCGYLTDDVGWSESTVLTASAANLSLEHPAFHSYKVLNPYNPREYFLFENRQQRGRDTRIPDSGLMFLHIDRDGSNIYNEMTPEFHYEASLEQADGRFDLERNVNRGDNTDLYRAAAFTTWGPDTRPDTRWWDGSESDFRVYDINYLGEEMTFSFEYAPKVTPVEPVRFEGDPVYGEGPFSTNFHFENPADEPVAWEVSSNVDWLAIPQVSGEMAQGGGADIAVGIDADSAPVAPGQYEAVVNFALPALGKFWTRRVVFEYVGYGPATADTDRDWSISLSEVLLGVQLFNTRYYRCAETSDGYAPGQEETHACAPYSADYAPQDWRVSLYELLRLIQLFNTGGYHRAAGTEDGFAPGIPK